MQMSSSNTVMPWGPLGGRGCGFLNYVTVDTVQNLMALCQIVGA